VCFAVELAVVIFGATDAETAAAKTAAVLGFVGEPASPALIWLVDDVVANAAVIIVIATEHLLGPEALEGFQAIKVAGFAAPERTATVAFAAVGTIIAFA